MHRPSKFQKLLSYLVPVRLYFATGGQENPILELCYYRGQYQLATIDALYSDGDRYRPVNVVCKHFANKLANVNSVLLLGTGLGSAVQVFRKRGYNPNFRMIDHDETILSWAKQILKPIDTQTIDTVCTDAETFIDEDHDTYDMLIVDIFKSRVVPDFVTTTEYLEKCKTHIKSGGCFAMNYIKQKNTDWDGIKKRIEFVFPNAQFIQDGANYIILSTV